MLGNKHPKMSQRSDLVTELMVKCRTWTHKLLMVSAVMGHVQSALGTKWKRGSFALDGGGNVTQGSGSEATPGRINRSLAGGKV